MYSPLALGLGTLAFSPSVGAGLGLGNSSVAGYFLSDENEKEKFKPVKGEEVLIKIGSMPMSEYNYTKDAQEKYGVPAERRMGPMAQDVAKVFPEISDGHTIDVPGIIGTLLTATKALDKRTAHLAKIGRAHV